MSDFYSDYTPDYTADAGQAGADTPAEPPSYMDVLPESGREVVVVGDVQGYRELNHAQGDNQYGFQGTCGLVSCQDVLGQFGVNVSEGDVVQFAVGNGLCSVTDSPESSGGTSVETQAQVLSDAGVPAETVSGADLNDLAGWVAQGHGVIVEVNAGELWDNADAYANGDANHAIVVTGVALDPQTGQVEGYYINDSGRGFPSDSGRFVSADLMQQAWADTGGTAAVTDQTHV
jgi:hypothetical protein